jgi:hypothetical protein
MDWRTWRVSRSNTGSSERRPPLGATCQYLLGCRSPGMVYPLCFSEQLSHSSEEIFDGDYRVCCRALLSEHSVTNHRCVIRVTESRRPKQRRSRCAALGTPVPIALFGGTWSGATWQFWRIASSASSRLHGPNPARDQTLSTVPDVTASTSTVRAMRRRNSPEIGIPQSGQALYVFALHLAH